MKAELVRFPVKNSNWTKTAPGFRATIAWSSRLWLSVSLWTPCGSAPGSGKRKGVSDFL